MIDLPLQPARRRWWVGSDGDSLAASQPAKMEEIQGEQATLKELKELREKLIYSSIDWALNGLSQIPLGQKSDWAEK